MMKRLPLRTGFIDVQRFGPVSHRFFREVEFAVDPVSFTVGVGPQLGARWWREILIAVALAHRTLLPEPAGLLIGPLTERYSSIDRL